MRHLLAPVILLMLTACQTDTQPNGNVTDTGAELAGSHWKLVEIQSMDDTTYKPEAEHVYSLKFSSDQGVQILAACNRGAATWQAGPGSSLEFSPFILTRMACPDASLDSRYTADLGTIRSYVIEAGQLHLATFADGAIMQFSRIPAECSNIVDGRDLLICQNPQLNDLSSRLNSLASDGHNETTFEQCTNPSELASCLENALKQKITAYEIRQGIKPELINYRCTDESKITVRFYEKTEIPAAVLSRSSDQRIVHLNNDERYSGENVDFWNRSEEASVKWDGTSIKCKRH